MSVIDLKTTDETFTSEKWPDSNALVHMWGSRWPYRHITSVACAPHVHMKTPEWGAPTLQRAITYVNHWKITHPPYPTAISFLSLLFLSGCLSLSLSLSLPRCVSVDTHKSQWTVTKRNVWHWFNAIIPPLLKALLNRQETPRKTQN